MPYGGYPWYTVISNSEELTQGDILADCPIPLPSSIVFEELKNADLKTDETIDINEPIEINSATLVVMTQACDIEQKKVDSLVVCPVWTLRELISVNPYFNASKARESLRQGNEPAFHLLNIYNSNDASMDLSVVEFHRIYALPKEYLKAVALSAGFRLRLLPPYREHLSQAFARYFMRVGLPIDIPKDIVKGYGRKQNDP